MDPQTAHNAKRAMWQLTAAQHGVVSRTQLLELGFTADAIKHRIRAGRLHAVTRGVYAVGRPGLEQRGIWMAAVLRCGVGAVLSHRSAAALWGLMDDEVSRPEVTVPVPRNPRASGITVFRRTCLTPADITTHDGIPVTTPICTLLDLGSVLVERRLEAAITEADKRDLVDPETLRAAADEPGSRRGAAPVRKLLDRTTFVLTESELERRFLPLARRAGLGPPLAGHWVNGFKVDFYWPELGLVVEVDGLRYHRTAAQQTRDRLRDQAHTAAGLTQLRFTYTQVRYESHYVVATLRSVAQRLSADRVLVRS